jgi:hypothetical protein
MHHSLHKPAFPQRFAFSAVFSLPSVLFCSLIRSALPANSLRFYFSVDCSFSIVEFSIALNRSALRRPTVPSEPLQLSIIASLCCFLYFSPSPVHNPVPIIDYRFHTTGSQSLHCIHLALDTLSVLSQSRSDKQIKQSKSICHKLAPVSQPEL